VNYKSLVRRVEGLERKSAVRPDYLPQVPRTFEGVLRFHLETSARLALDSSEGTRLQLTCKNVRDATDAQLLEVLGYSADGDGMVEFVLVKQHWFALTFHNFGMPHNCGAFCPVTFPKARPFVPGAPIFQAEYQRIRANRNASKIPSAGSFSNTVGEHVSTQDPIIAEIVLLVRARARVDPAGVQALVNELRTVVEQIKRRQGESQKDEVIEESSA
jgi:hypothetical protein